MRARASVKHYLLQTQRVLCLTTLPCRRSVQPDEPAGAGHQRAPCRGGQRRLGDLQVCAGRAAAGPAPPNSTVITIPPSFFALLYCKKLTRSNAAAMAMASHGVRLLALPVEILGGVQVPCVDVLWRTAATPGCRGHRTAQHSSEGAINGRPSDELHHAGGVGAVGKNSSGCASG